MNRKDEPIGDIKRSSCGEGDVGRLCSLVVRAVDRQSKDLGSDPSSVKSVFFPHKDFKFFKFNYLLLLNENLLNFTICRNTKLEGAISGLDRAPILQAQIWARSGGAFHYWSGARQITLSEPHFSRSAPHQNFCTD